MDNIKTHKKYLENQKHEEISGADVECEKIGVYSKGIIEKIELQKIKKLGCQAIYDGKIILSK